MIEKGKLFKSVKDLEFEIKIGNKIICDKSMKYLLIRENINRDLIKR